MQLAEEARGPLASTLSPVAALSPDGRTLVYSAWRELTGRDGQRPAPGTLEAVPSIRALDLVSGADVLIEEGAVSAAWREDGALACVRGAQAAYALDRPYTGHVVVRAAPDAPAEPWTTGAARYIVAAWAGPRLLVYRVDCCEQAELLVLDRPGALRRLGPAAEGTDLVAVSPDGARALIWQAPWPPVARLMDVAGGTELAALDLSQATDPGIDWLSRAGSWAGDRVVAEGALAGGTPALVVLFAGPRALAVEQVLTFDAGRFPLGLNEPGFADRQGTRVVAWAPHPPEEGVARPVEAVDCDLASRLCVVSEAGINARPVAVLPAWP